ncbi:MAG: hypothetical protein LKE46_09085 [Clostridium sp.]|jgi:hypothetical protein|uniref:hypothetical protein n=1 Tax=Clostridium sp. TaxID=1506 RepID=UPI0025C5A2A1|nr:hypothetical protein [Clostridium sp.]MCH3964421.1 hypothetical protein [Clostridium sp.]MCI1715596.1 hypothetical protein [Clostridium sp.]MCI1799612.1 hypothetical protein [Clostridium sp.]MCI1813780.1 hypothetical protein [Clostridium sp.]MCI1870425.1 hypothetical protein [Clostridium sp.]
MKMKKGNFLTVVFSFLPGAGHMYMGFMKMGLSFMSLFFFIIFLSSWLHIGPLLFVLPLIWFYSFFDCINKQYMPEEKFNMLQDEYMFSMDKILKFDGNLFKKRRLFFGVLLILLGIYLVWDNLKYALAPYMDSRVYDFICGLGTIVPQVVVGAVITVIGIKLIIGRKKEDNLE